MTDENQARSGEDDEIDRRSMLKGTAAAGLAGVGATGVGAAADASQSAELPHQVTIEPGSQGQRVAYHFRVSGTVEPGPEAGTLGVDTIEDNVVQGRVGGSIEGNDDPVDDYRFSGAIAFADSDGPLSVTLDINGGVDAQGGNGGGADGDGNADADGGTDAGGDDANGDGANDDGGADGGGDANAGGNANGGGGGPDDGGPNGGADDGADDDDAGPGGVVFGDDSDDDDDDDN